MDHRRRETGALAVDARMEEAEGQIRILEPPPLVGLVKTVDGKQVLPPGGQIAGHHPVPAACRAVCAATREPEASRAGGNG